jgi:hypothetical protein
MKREFAWLTTAAFGAAATAYAVTQTVRCWGKHEEVDLRRPLRAAMRAGRVARRRGRMLRALREGQTS